MEILSPIKIEISYSNETLYTYVIKVDGTNFYLTYGKTKNLKQGSTVYTSDNIPLTTTLKNQQIVDLIVAKNEPEAPFILISNDTNFELLRVNITDRSVSQILLDKGKPTIMVAGLDFISFAAYYNYYQ